MCPQDRNIRTGRLNFAMGAVDFLPGRIRLAAGHRFQKNAQMRAIQLWEQGKPDLMMIGAASPHGSERCCP
jgi:hypothetical protein